jgi:hypothetical protein
MNAIIESYSEVQAPVHAAVKTAIANPSAYQQALFNWVVYGEGNTVVNAVGGLG